MPLPADIQVVQPSEALAAEVKSFSGRWAGAGDGTLDHVLVVEEIASPDRVTAVYAWARTNT